MTLDHDAQETLVTGLKAGRADAFDRLYDALHARVFNFVARTVGDREEAADITQEVFLEAYRRIPAVPGDVRLEPWIYRVAANTATDHLRRRRVRRGEPLPDGERLAAPHDAYDAYRQSETAALVGAALMDMNDRYRAALVLKDLHGLDNREVASVLGVSRGRADVLLFRARHAFKKTYSRLSGEPLSTVGKVAGLAPLLPALAVPAALHGLRRCRRRRCGVPRRDSGRLRGDRGRRCAADVSAPVAAGLLRQAHRRVSSPRRRRWSRPRRSSAAARSSPSRVCRHLRRPPGPEPTTSADPLAGGGAGGTSVTADDLGDDDWAGHDDDADVALTAS